MRKRDDKVIVTIAGCGRFEWWESLQLVMFVPTGKQRETNTWVLDSRKNTFEGAVRKVGRVLQGFQMPRQAGLQDQPVVG